MKPWTVDADDIRIAGDLDGKLVHRTPSIDDFLRQRSNKFIVTATKGFGKTLLIKAQRIAHENKGVRCLPDNGLIDKPVGDRVFSRQMIQLYAESTENWRRVWLISIATATLKALDLTRGLEVNDRLAGVVADESLNGVIDHFVHVLSFRRNELFRSADDADAVMLPRLRNIQSPIAIFIDSVDEYFKKHLLEMTPSDTGELNRGVWYYSQMGLVEAAYQLRRICHHLKVYAAVRKEAFERFEHTTEMVQQYRGSAIDLSYRPEGLESIFVNNIRHERKHNLVAPGKLKSSPLGAFLGLTELAHSYTGEVEPVFDYIYRHTLGRPRDLMTIGQKLSDLAPEDRTAGTIKRAVNLAATGIAHEYLNEIRPYLDGIDIEEIFSLLPANVMAAATVDAVLERHPVQREGLEVLGAAGLIGSVVVDPVTSSKVQRFAVPGEHPLNVHTQLPASSHYLVHPILTQIISTPNPAYLSGIDRTNIIGQERPWRETQRERRLSVLKADIFKFSDIMEAGLEEAVREAYLDIAMSHTRGCVQCEITDGDTLTIVHSEPGALLKAIKRIMEDMYEVAGHPRLRVAIDFGPVRIKHDAEQRQIATGVPFRRAARIEPHVPPNQIWVTAEFRAELDNADTLYQAVPAHPAGAQPDTLRQGRINVRKPGSQEQDLWLDLYQVEEKKF